MVPEFEESVELAGVVLFASITAFLSRLDRVIYSVQHVVSCRIAKVFFKGAVTFLEVQHKKQGLSRNCLA